MLSSYSSDVSLIGDDTDLLVLLLQMTRHQAFEHKLFLTTKSQVYNMEELRNKLGQRIVNGILLIHAFTGCDTTSRIHGIGKDKLLKIIDSIDSDIINAFYSMDSSASQVKDAGEQLLLLLLSSNAMSLNDARLLVLEQKVLSSSIDIKCQQLPPASGAAEQHSYRVYHQIQQWEGTNLDPSVW